MKILKRIPKYIFFGLLFTAFVGTAIQAHPNATNQDVVYVVNSLNAAGTSLVTLTITINLAGDATVAKSTGPSGTGDQTKMHILGSDIDFVTGCTDSCHFEITDNIPNQHCFWFNIELGSNPSIQTGGADITFYCLSYGCDAGGKCDPSAVITNNKANVTCVGPCQRCELKAKPSGSSVKTGGGVFLFAKTVSYI